MEKVETKDWSQLPRDLLVSITNCFGAFEDIVSFSSVCSSWRRSALLREQQQNCSKRCVPWLFLNEPDDFWIPTMNKENNKYRVKEPLITNAKHCWGSSIGWVFTLANDNTTALINPLTGVRTTLPPLTKSISRALVFADNNNNITVMVISDHQDGLKLAFARPGFGEWITLQDNENGGFADVACNKDKIFGVRANGALVMCEIDNVSDARVSNFAPPPELVNFDHVGRIYLIESAGDLLMALVRRMYSKRNEVFVQVYKFDIETRRWGELTDLGNRALFLGDNYSISVFPANGVDCIANCIYFGCGRFKIWTTSVRTKQETLQPYPHHDLGDPRHRELCC